jgi:hypothetical protein
MKPEDLFSAEDFPDELKWVPAHYKLHPSDPVYLLIAWYWRRVKKSEDTMQSALLDMKTSLDSRIASLKTMTDSAAAVGDALKQVQELLAAKPAQLGKELDAQLKEPIAAALARLAALEKSLAPVARSFEVAQKRQILAVLLIGVSFGLIAAGILFRA